MKKIIVIYVISSLRACGPVNVLYNIVRYIDMEKYSIHIISLKGEGLESRASDFNALGCELINLNLGLLEMHLKGKEKLDEIFKRINPDVIHAQCFRSALYISKYEGRYNLCATVHNYPHIDFKYKYGVILGTIMYKNYINALRRINRVIACSESVAKELKDVFGLNVSSIENGIEPHSMRLDDIEKAELKKFLSLPGGKKILISVGALIERKDPIFLINSFNRAEIPNCVLVVLGNGKLENKCREIAGENVYCVGNVSNVAEYLAVADIFVSSAKAEGLPNAVLEAMSAGVPILVSDIEPHLEIYEKNKMIGRTYKINEYQSFKENLLYLINAERALISQNEINLIKKYFSAEIMSSKYQNVYSQIQDYI